MAVSASGARASRTPQTLRRCHDQLAPGGTLVFDHHLPYIHANEWPYWLAEPRRELPHAWPAGSMRRRAADGDEIELRSRLVALDPLEQTLTRQIRASLWRGEAFVAEEEHNLRENLYFRNEILLLLAQAGFAEAMVRGGYTDAAPTADDTMLVFVARA